MTTQSMWAVEHVFLLFITLFQGNTHSICAMCETLHVCSDSSQHNNIMTDYSCLTLSQFASSQTSLKINCTTTTSNEC